MGPGNFLQPSSDGFRQGQLIRKTILPQEPIIDIWNLFSVLLLSLWGTEPVACMFGASHEAGNGLINSPRSSHTSNWESDMRLARGQGIFSKCMLMVATVYSEGSRKGLPSSKELGQAQPFGETKALQWSRKRELMITINTCRAHADNKVLSSVQPQYQ